MEKLIIAYLGSSKETRIERHGLFIGIGESYNDPKIVNQMKASWSEGTHIDDAVELEMLPGFRIEITEDKSQTSKNGYFLYAVWIGWYDICEHQEPIPGMYKFPTESHQMFFFVVKNPSEIGELLMNFEPYAKGQNITSGPRSHTDNQHALVSDIDNTINISEIISKEHDFGIKITKVELSTEDNNVQFHGYGKYDKMLNKK